MNESMVELKEVLTKAGARFKGETSCTCPFHRDTNPSAGIYAMESGKWRFKCQVCGDNLDTIGVEAKLSGKSPEDIIRSRETREERTPTYSEEQIRQMFSVERGFKYLHEYHDEKGSTTHFVACKYEGEHKKFTQISRFGFNFVLKNNTAKNPIFRLDKVKDKNTVVIVEGEKCVYALEYIGIDYATTTIGGAKNAKKSDLTPLRGKRIVIWPDNDKAGMEYLADLTQILTSLDCSIATIDPNEMMLGDAEDCADYIKKHIKSYSAEELKADIEQTIKEARTSGYFDSFEKQRIADLESGELKSFDIGWPCLSDSKWMIGGTVTTLCAKPGVGKTWLVHNLMIRAVEKGIKVANIQLEEDKDYHIARILSTMAGISCDPDNTTTEDLRRMRESRELVNEIAKSLVIPDFDKCSLTDIAEIVKQKAEAGCKIIIVDSISVAEKNPKNSWMDDQLFVNRIKFVTRLHKSRVILVTHPKTSASSTNREGKQITTMSMDTMSGGTAYQRLSQTILWLHDVEEGTQTLNWYHKGNRGITVLKARNKSKKTSSNKVLFQFEHGRFHELGYF